MTLWFLARALGMVALLAFTLSVVLGATSSDTELPTHIQDRDAAIDRRVLRQLAHRSAAGIGLVALAAHLVLILLDSYVSVTVLGALIPFTAGYAPVALGLGTIAVMLFLVVAITGAARGRLATSARAAAGWRAVHALAYLGWALAMGHGIFAGTDTGTLWTTTVYAACGIAFAGAMGTRLVRADRHDHRPLARARDLQPTGQRP
jgi:methionine sulfoxide reductase heme-binding subunit